MGQRQFDMLEKPLEKHYAQGQTYLMMANKTLKKVKIKLLKGIIFFYECKNDQSRKEYFVLLDEEYLAQVKKRLKKLKRTYKAGKIPKRPYIKGSKQCKECGLFDWCWEEKK
jgi:CRISPR/Cas system-associated exonuclease Cas4 (RecB family)